MSKTKNNHRGGIITWLVLVIVIALGAWLLWTFRFAAGPLEEFEKPVVQEEVKEEEEKKPAKKFKEPSAEEKVALDEKALLNALKSASPEDCDAIRWNDELKTECKDTAYTAETLKSKDSSGCSAIVNPVLRQECLDQIAYTAALEGRSVEACSDIVDAVLKQQCIDLLNVSIAKTAESADECDVITDETARAKCKDEFYLTDSIESLDEGSCANIEDAASQTRCVNTIALQRANYENAQTIKSRTIVSNEQQLQNCSNLDGLQSSTCADTANFNLAFEKKDLTYCNAISDANKKSQCFIEQGAKIDQFYLGQATAQKNPELCSKVSDAQAQILCQQFASQ